MLKIIKTLIHQVVHFFRKYWFYIARPFWSATAFRPFNKFPNPSLVETKVSAALDKSLVHLSSDRLITCQSQIWDVWGREEWTRGQHRGKGRGSKSIQSIPFAVSLKCFEISQYALKIMPASSSPNFWIFDLYYLKEGITDHSTQLSFSTISERTRKLRLSIFPVVFVCGRTVCTAAS